MCLPVSQHLLNADAESTCLLYATTTATTAMEEQGRQTPHAGHLHNPIVCPRIPKQSTHIRATHMLGLEPFVTSPCIDKSDDKLRTQGISTIRSPFSCDEFTRNGLPINIRAVTLFPQKVASCTRDLPLLPFVSNTEIWISLAQHTAVRFSIAAMCAPGSKEYNDRRYLCAQKTYPAEVRSCAIRVSKQIAVNALYICRNEIRN